MGRPPGLPYPYLQHLDAPWPLIGKRIHVALNQGHDPYFAVKLAFAQTRESEREKIKGTLLQVLPVMQIPGLSYRQREALIALRASNVASLAQLSRVLVQDRANTHRRLSALVKKGLAVKFYQPGGVYYFAIPKPLEKSVKAAVSRFINNLIQEYSSTPATPATPALPAPLALPAMPANTDNSDNSDNAYNFDLIDNIGTSTMAF